MPTDACRKLTYVGVATTDEIACFALDTRPDLSFALDHTNTLKAIPRITRRKARKIVCDPILARLDASVPLFNRFVCRELLLIVCTQRCKCGHDVLIKGLLIGFDADRVVGFGSTNVLDGASLTMERIGRNIAVTHINDRQNRWCQPVCAVLPRSCLA